MRVRTREEDDTRKKWTRDGLRCDFGLRTEVVALFGISENSTVYFGGRMN
jgi:hypothetical protein